MKCPACGTRNNFYHRYCYFCGEKLGAMIDPPDQEDGSRDQEHDVPGGDRAFSPHDDHDTISERSAFSIVEKEDYSKEAYFTQENKSVDMPEDYFGYPEEGASTSPDTDNMEDIEEAQADDIDYFGYPPSSQEDPGQDTREDIAADTTPADRSGYSAEFQAGRSIRDTQADTYPDTSQDYSGDLAGGTGEPSGDTISSIEEDIAAKISYMEKYMDDYLSGRIKDRDTAPTEEEGENTPIYNDSLDFIRIEEEEPARPAPAPVPKPGPKPEPGPEPKLEPRPEPKPVPRREPPVMPPTPAPTDADADTEADEYDPYEDEETSKMIDMLYRDDASSGESSYPRRSHRHASVNETETAEEPPDNTDGNTVVKVMISLVIIAMMGFAGYVLWNEFLNPNKVPAVSTADLIVTHILDRDTLEDGTSGQRLTLYVQNGAIATIFGETYPVENEKVQQFYSDSFLNEQYEIAGELTEDGKKILPVIAVAYDADGKSMEHKVVFEISSPSVSLAIFSPEGDTVEVQGNTCTLEISVQPGAMLYINDADYTDQVGADGLAVIDIDVPGTEEMTVRIRASLDGYADAEKTITLVPAQAAVAESLLTLNESIPVSTTSSEVVLTGQVPAGAAIETSLPQSGSPTVTESGAFSLTVRIPGRPGYSVCLIRVLLNGTQVDQQEVVIDRTATFNEYTTGPWEFSPYEDYKASPDLHEGYRFQVPGKVKEIISQADGLTVCTVDANPGGAEQLIRVWFWGDFSHAAGSSVTVYGNRWGNEAGVPRILAKYIISS